MFLGCLDVGLAGHANASAGRREMCSGHQIGGWGTQVSHPSMAQGYTVLKHWC